MTDKTYILVCDILRNSNDGNNLNETQLKMTEMAVNDQLNEAGFVVLRDLHEELLEGQPIPS